MLKRLSVASLLVTSLRNNRSSLNVFSSWSSIRCFSASDSSRAGDGSARGRTSIARRAREKNKKSDNRSINNRVPYDYAHPNFITYLMSPTQPSKNPWSHSSPFSETNNCNSSNPPPNKPFLGTETLPHINYTSCQLLTPFEKKKCYQKTKHRDHIIIGFTVNLVYQPVSFLVGALLPHQELIL